MLGALFGFKGRLSRPGFWEVLAAIVLIDAVLLVGRMFVEDSGLPGGYGPQSPLSMGVAHWIPWVMGIFTVWSLLAAMVKRCHDRGRTGALVLLALIPLIGWLWLLVDLFVLAGSRGKNRYGSAPHAPASDLPPAFTWGAEPAVAAAANPDAHTHAHRAHGEAPDAPDAEAHDHGHEAQGHDDHGHHAHGEEAHGPRDEGAHEAVHSNDGHAAHDHAAEALGESHPGSHDHGHHSAAPHAQDHHGGDAGAAHASTHVTVAHAH